MADCEKHAIQAKHNMALLSKLDSMISEDPFNDWKATILFYTAMHSIHSFLAINDVHIQTHAKLIDSLVDYKELRMFWRDYQSLYSLSKRSRYYCCQIKDSEVEKAKQKVKNIYKQLIGA